MRYLKLIPLVILIISVWYFGFRYRVGSSIDVFEDESRFPKKQKHVFIDIWIYKGIAPVSSVHSNTWICSYDKLDSIIEVAKAEIKYATAVGDSLIKIRDQK